MLLQFILHILGYDIWFYVSHRMLHWPIFWWIHAQHHERVTDLRWPDAYHGHWLETLIQCAGFLFPAAIGLWEWPVAFAAAALINARGLARHDARLSWLIGTHHLRHHAMPKWNFGEPWIDALCGTKSVPPGDPLVPRTCT